MSMHEYEQTKVIKENVKEHLTYYRTPNDTKYAYITTSCNKHIKEAENLNKYVKYSPYKSYKTSQTYNC